MQAAGGQFLIDRSVREVFRELTENKKSPRRNTGRKSHYAHWQVFFYNVFQ